MKIFSGGILLVLLVLWFVFLRDNDSSDSASDEVVSKEEIGASPSLENQGIRFIGENPFTEEYGQAGGDTKSDLEALRDVVIHCQSLMKNFDTFHLPGNPEIVRFLQGGNPEKLAWIPTEHPLIQADGVLVDRNGTPVFFHRLSGLQIEYRSAGADGKHWTDDDIVVR